MKATVQSITNFMDGKNTHFSIPVYQRNYDWSSKDQCKVLWDDLCQLAKSDSEPPHFFGAIVSVRDWATDDLIIIDGQQRLTTVSVLLLAMLNKIREYKQMEDSQDLPAEREIENLCMDYKNKQKLKLKLLRNDMAAYECIADGRMCDNFSRNKVYQNYKYFYSLLTPENINVIYSACQKLQVVVIMLSNEDDSPQSVFESLNAKGLKLSDADKIRNYVLMGLDYDEQKRLYSDYWEKMELNAGSGINQDATTTYIWRFMQYKNNQKTSEKDTYVLFKKYKQTLNVSTEELLQEMLHMSYVYHDIQTQQIKLQNSDELSKKINAKISVFYDLKQTICEPLWMDVIDNYYKGKLSEHDVICVLDVLESYLVRRAITKAPNAGLNGFLLMNIQINKILNNYPDATYVDALKYIIYSANGRETCPDNETVRASLQDLALYTSNKSMCRYILESLEKNHSKDCTLTTGNLSIEHIMPQNLNKDWIEALGADYSMIHNKYLHTLGNLTLTGYNSVYSDYSFAKKKRLAATGFDYSPLYLNEYMKTVDVWGKEQICARANKLAKDCLQIWPDIKPNNIYQIQVDNIDSVALDNHLITDIITKKKPISAEFMNETINAGNSWKSLYVNLINILYEQPEYKSKMQNAFGYGNQGNFENIVAKTAVNQGQKGEIFWEQIIPDNSVYFRINKSAGDFIKAIKVWFEYLGIDESELLIYLK